MLKILEINFNVLRIGKIAWENHHYSKDNDAVFRLQYKANPAFRNLLFHLGSLKKHQDDFDQFLHVVKEDIQAKMHKWTEMRAASHLNQKSFASLQLFMLSRYSRRISRFEKASEESIRNIQFEYQKKKSVREDLVNRHLHILGKMMRRMKHIMDVSDKYAVVEIIDVINFISEASKDVDPSVDLKNSKDPRQSVANFPPFKKVTSSSFSSMESYDSSSLSTKSRLSDIRFKTVQSLIEHIFVLTKTYTERE